MCCLKILKQLSKTMAKQGRIIKKKLMKLNIDSTKN